MVDALRSARRALRPGGMLIDLRPDASRPPRLVVGGRVVGRLAGSAASQLDDTAADQAVQSLVAADLLHRVATGHRWCSTTYASLAEVDAYVRAGRRFDRYERGSRAALFPFRRGPIVARRSLKFDVLQRVR